MQLEDGRLLLWRIKDDAIVRWVSKGEWCTTCTLSGGGQDLCCTACCTVTCAKGDAAESEGGGACFCVQKSLDPGDESAAAEASAWAENPNIIPSILDPAALTLTGAS